VSAYEDADIVISAPGGPYFGDNYWTHEPVHWFFVWLGKLHKKRLFLYSPSVGPFRKSLFNNLRRKLFFLFDRLCVREVQSAKFLEELMGHQKEILLTADSAIQEEITAYDRTDYFQDHPHLADKFLVAVTGMQYLFPGEKDPAMKRAQFTEAFVVCLEHIAVRRKTHFMFLPQLCGQVHSDTEYHYLLAQRLPLGTTWEIIPADKDSDYHRRVFGMADFCLVSRYHPQIFATSNGVPGVFPFYEHKQLGYLKEMAMLDFSCDVRSMNGVHMCRLIDQVLDRRLEISEMLRERIVSLRKRARLSTSVAMEIIRKTHGN
jgi:colanic acid/amylovoran biosynthesis protein